MLRGLFVVKQPTVLDGLAFDPFSFQQDGLTAPEVDVGRGEIVDALVTAPVVVVRDEYIDLSFEIADCAAEGDWLRTRSCTIVTQQVRCRGTRPVV